MPNIKSAIKRMRQNAKRRTANRQQRSALRTSIKKVTVQLAAGDAAVVQSQLPLTLSTVDKAASKGLIHKNKAARHASRMMKQANALQAKATS